MQAQNQCASIGKDERLAREKLHANPLQPARDPVGIRQEALWRPLAPGLGQTAKESAIASGLQSGSNSALASEAVAEVRLFDDLS